MTQEIPRDVQTHQYLRVPKYARTKDIGPSTFWRLVQKTPELQAAVVRPTPRITLIDIAAADAWFSRQASGALQKVAA